MKECPMCPLDDIEPIEHDDYCLECQRLTKERQAKAELAKEAIDLLELIVDDMGSDVLQMGRDFLVKVGERVPCPSCDAVVRPIHCCNQCGAKLKEIADG